MLQSAVSAVGFDRESSFARVVAALANRKHCQLIRVVANPLPRALYTRGEALLKFKCPGSQEPLLLPRTL